MTAAARLGLTLVLTALLAALTLAGPAAGATSAKATSHVQHRSAAAIVHYWTKKRMRSAEPVEVPAAKPSVTAGAAPTPTGPPSYVAGTVPGQTGVPSLQSGSVASAEQPAPKASIPFSRGEVTQTTTYPYSTHGKVFFRQGSSNYVCSGTVVTSATKSAVMTAGHCVHPGGGASKPWNKNWAFVPGYRLGNRPWGTFTASKLTSVNGWVRNGSFAYDIGGATLRRNGAGQTVQAVAGSRGVAWNQPRNQSFLAFGYPATPPFSGGRLYYCSSNYGGSDPSSGSPAPMKIGCDMTGGSSGGGWIIAQQYVNSVNSYGYKSMPNVMHGPYFGTAARTVYNAIK